MSPARSSMLPTTPAISSMMNVSLAVAAPVRFSIRLKPSGLKPATSVPDPIPVRSHGLYIDINFNRVIETKHNACNRGDICIDPVFTVGAGHFDIQGRLNWNRRSGS